MAAVSQNQITPTWVTEKVNRAHICANWHRNRTIERVKSVFGRELGERETPFAILHTLRLQRLVAQISPRCQQALKARLENMFEALAEEYDELNGMQGFPNFLTHLDIQTNLDV